MTVQAVKLGTSFNGDFQGDGVPRFDAAYLVLSAPSSQTPIKIAGTDEGALWDAGSPEEISGWGSTGVFGSPVNGLRAATGERDPGFDLQRRLRLRLRRRHDGLRRISERRRRHLLRRQRRATPGSAPGRRLPLGRHHRMGPGLCRSRLARRLYACRRTRRCGR